VYARTTYQGTYNRSCFAQPFCSKEDDSLTCRCWLETTLLILIIDCAQCPVPSLPCTFHYVE
jgi:hypothetical protein